MPRLRPTILSTVLMLAALGQPAHAQAQVEAQRASSAVQHLHFRFGPVRIKPGQNTISFDATRRRPKVDGYITSVTPNLVRADGKAPPVDVIHLHHAVWLVNLRPTWAAGEEKTAMRLPPGFGWRYRTSDRWILNHMIHNLTANDDRVWVTCRLPCTGQAGIAFPVANGTVFDSGELGFGPAGFTAAANRATWSTPGTLTPGTYAYSCRVHPFMHGAFRVKG